MSGQATPEGFRNYIRDRLEGFLAAATQQVDSVWQKAAARGVLNSGGTIRLTIEAVRGVVAEAVDDALGELTRIVSTTGLDRSVLWPILQQELQEFVRRAKNAAKPDHLHRMGNGTAARGKIYDSLAEFDAALARKLRFFDDGFLPQSASARQESTTSSNTQPADELISDSLISFDEGGVHYAWERAIERRASDPEGAITAARTLLETVCKHIIEETGGTYGENDDLPKLYHTAADALDLAPNQQTEETLRAMLGNCQAVVGRLAELRNKLGDAHGKGKNAVRAQPHHAELAVNLAGTVATFLVSTWNARKAEGDG